jgi:hypothetical protein
MAPAFLKVNVPGTAGDTVTLDMKSARVSFKTTLISFGNTILGFGMITVSDAFAYEGK